jgi:flagellar basal-body rod protein FlgB
MSKLGNKNFALLGRMLDLTQERHRVIAGNIANVNTPNYQRRAYNFNDSLKYAMEQGSVNAYRNVQGFVDRPKTTPVRNNGNNVDIDLEMLNMRENSAYYKTLVELYNKKSGLVKRAITGGNG